ncbi:MAG: tetratricopeptide repeat protein [Thermoguttaceae bacterium]
MATIPEALAIAIQHHQGGRLQAAEQIYRQILAVEPNHADVIHLLGVLAHQVGNPDEAVACYCRALELKPDYAEAHNNLGVALKEQGKMAEAVACWRQAVKLKPDYVETHYNLGNVLKEQGRLDEAIACYRQALTLKPDFVEIHINLGIALKEQGKLDEAITRCRGALELKPDYADAHCNLGVALKEQGKLGEAIACWRRALELKPDFAVAHNNLGVAFKEQRKLDEAVACYRRALELKPGYAEAHNNLGVAYKELGKLEEALACCRRALELKPGYAEAHNNLGVTCKELGRLDEAVACCRRALELKPDFAVAHNNLGNALKDQGKLDETVACYRRALELKPDYAEAHNNLGNALKDQGKLDEAVACYRRALELKPDYAEAHSNLLFALQYCTGVTPAALAEAHAEYDRRHAAPLCGAVTQYENVRDRRGWLRLGFVSPDLGRHPVGYFLVRVLETLRQTPHETICYSDRILKDDLTHRLRAAATQWRDVIGMSNQRLAEQIRADRIDILFDLAGHTAHNRLLVFARKPAAIQVTWAGYVGTTGLKGMDYLLADRYEVPPGAERHYQERVLRMPDGYVCYDPPVYAPQVAALPALNRGQVTFGCFNNPAKITPQAIEVWARILRRLPKARLVLKFKGWNDSGVARRFIEMFATQAIDPARLELLGFSPHVELLAEYNRIDLALDPFPYCGGLTTCEALWMGVPVVTCPGETFASRHSLSHLSSVGLTETIGCDLDDYVELAVSTAGDLPRLAALRAGLRQRVAASPLCDGKRFATNLISMLHDVQEQ